MPKSAARAACHPEGRSVAQDGEAVDGRARGAIAPLEGYGDKTKMKLENSVQAAENMASEELFPNLQEHLNYANDAYNLAFRIQQLLDGRNYSDTSDVQRAQFMILMRITDFLRCVQLLAIKGYPEQAGTLAASIFELAHTALFFTHSPDKATAWLNADSIKQEMPRDVLCKSWEKVVRVNCNHDEVSRKSEYRIYQQLCWMKHSLPKMQDMRVADRNRISSIFGPHKDERAINHAWFALQHSGRLTELVISLLLNKFSDSEAEKELKRIAIKREELNQKAIERFGQQNPFSNEV